MAIGVMNATTYGLTLAAARLLGPAQFGQFSALLGVLIIVNVLSLGLQATGARRLATTPASRSSIEASVMRLTRWSAVTLTLLSVALSPVLAHILRLDSVWSAVLMGVSAGFLCLMGGQSGILQGEQRWVPLALVYSTMGLARFVLGLVALILAPTANGAMVGVALAAVVPVFVGALALRRPTDTPAKPPVGAEPPESWIKFQEGPMLREIAHSSHALLAFFVMSNVDIVLARALLPDHHGGLYASGLILTKAALFMPQFVVVFLFPAMAKSPTARQTHFVGAGLIALSGAVAAALVFLLPRLSLELVGGAQYRDISSWLWLFTALGTVLAVIQLLVYGALAQRYSRLVWALWGGVLVTVLAATQVDDAATLLIVKVTIDSVLLLVLFVILAISARGRIAREAAVIDPPLAEDTSSPEQPAVR